MPKFFLFFMLGFIAAATAEAAPLVLDDSTYYNILPPGGRLECFYDKSNYGYLFVRSSDGSETEIYTITNGVNEGEKTKVIAQKMKRGLTMLVLQHKNRVENDVKYLNFMISTQRIPRVGYKFSAVFYITEGFYKKQESGTEEVEELSNGIRSLLQCDFVK